MTAQVLCFNVTALCLLAAGWLSVMEPLRQRDFAGPIAVLLLGAITCVALLIADRWLSIGQGPFITLYEILISGLFGLALVYGIAYWRCPEIRVGAPVALAVLLLLLLWSGRVSTGVTLLPPTYDTPWLWAHLAAGKLFLGCCLVAASIAVLLVLPLAWRRALLAHGSLREEVLEQHAWRWLLAAFVFHSAMLLAGAVWAQDAWGRYWDWDPLETWAFVTWLTMAFGLHLRTSRRAGRRLGPAIVVASFVLAFLTFFGVPFISLSPHQGAV